MGVQLVYFLVFARPSPIICFVDFYLLNPVTMLFQRNWTSNDFSIRERSVIAVCVLPINAFADRMGTGNYGTTYEAVVKKVSTS